jgi:hypothetical protein
VAAILASLWIVAPVAAAVHAQLHEHRYCAEHATFEHDEAGERGAAAPEPHAVIAGAEDGAAEAAHEACAFTTFTSRAANGAPCHDAARVPVEHAPQAPPAHETDAPPIPLLLTAPKSSPPLAV